MIMPPNALRKLLTWVISVLSVVVLAIVLNELNHWFSLRWLAYQVKRNVDAAELQQWATNLLAHHGGDLGGYQGFLWYEYAVRS